MNVDEFGDRMKSLESVYTSVRVPPCQYLAVRLDGKGFSKYTKPFRKPFDQRLTDAMIETTRQLVKDTHATIGYVQSDEITLLFSVNGKSSEHIFGGKVSKINSILASQATATFNHHIMMSSSEVLSGRRYATFDCRAWAVPTLHEASNVFLWRAQDCRKNAVSALFRWTAGAKRMHGLTQLQMQTILNDEFGGRWDTLLDRYKHGTFVKRITRDVVLTDYELESIPSDHRPIGPVKRSFVETMPWEYFGDMPFDRRLVAVNRVVS